MTKKKKTEELSNPQAWAAEWVKLKGQKLSIEKKCEELKKLLEPYLEDQPEKVALLAGWKFSLVETTREFFRLNEAKEKIDGRVLAPYITKSTFNQIRTFWDGKEEEAEAA
jgi:hypothetical protein